MFSKQTFFFLKHKILFQVFKQLVLLSLSVYIFKKKHRSMPDRLLNFIRSFQFFCYSFLRDLSRRKIESVFRHFTQFNIRKTDFSRINIGKMDCSKNLLSEKHTFQKIHYQENELITKFNILVGKFPVFS